MKQYLDTLQMVLDTGIKSEDRTGTGTISVFGPQMRFDLSKGFPHVTTKRVLLRLVFEELMWFLRGESNIRPLVLKGVNIWNKDAYRYYKEKQSRVLNMDLSKDEIAELAIEKGLLLSDEDYVSLIKMDKGFALEHGDLGRIYGVQWRKWRNKDGKEIDQISQLIKDIKVNPYSRRLKVNAWNPGELEYAALPPCHSEFQCWVRENKLSLKVNIRSNDMFLGSPFNISSYAMLIHFIAAECNLEVGELIVSIGDSHIYLNHLDQVNEQLTREPRALPEFRILNKQENIWDYEWEDVELVGYNPHPPIKGDMST